jgi:hypothetical protein
LLSLGEDVIILADIEYITTGGADTVLRFVPSDGKDVLDPECSSTSSDLGSCGV